MPNIIVHTTDVNGDGSGDLVYLLRWLKFFDKYYKGKIPQRVFILASEPSQINAQLLSLANSDPTHPIFNFFTIEDKSVKPKIALGVKLGALKATRHRETVALKEHFAEIQESDHVTVIQVSNNWNAFRKTSLPDSGIDKTFGIYEFDSLIAAHAKKTMTESSLGLEADDFGLLHDVDGITGNESLTEIIEQLSAPLKTLLFQNKDITNAAALEFLTTVPCVLAYCPPFYIPAALNAVLESPIVKAAIADGKKPLFFITTNNPRVGIPESLKKAASANKITLVRTWLTSKDYNLVNAIFMNKKTKSIIIPAGDNTTTECIKAGKFPLYAHKPVLSDSEFQANFKCGIFKSMLRILKEQAKTLAWDRHPGFTSCCKVLTYLARKPKNDKIIAHYDDMHKYLTADIFDFFATNLSPYLMDNFAFERKTLPRLLKMIHDSQPSATTAAPVATATTTVQFDRTREHARQDVAASQTTGKPLSTGFKPGFLLL